MIFVNSMSDLFQEGVPDEFVIRAAKVMQFATWHTFQVLTKRADRMRQLLEGKLSFAAELQNVWWGVSVEDRKYGIPRVEHLRKANATVRFLSVEPLLEDLGSFSLDKIDWVIVGGESGPGARPMSHSWVINIRNLCRRSDVKFFFKQWGGVRKAENGRILAGRTYDELPHRTSSPVASAVERAAYIRMLETPELVRIAS
jgi:protein gp37